MIGGLQLWRNIMETRVSMTAACRKVVQRLKCAVGRPMTSQMSSMDREDYVLAVMSTAGLNAFTPVQLQKLFFLLDARASDDLGRKYFNFTPYDYGPFDSDVYTAVERLAGEGLAVVEGSGPWRRYRLTPEGKSEGEKLFGELGERVREFAARCSGTVRGMSFSQLVSAIYKEFPEMKANSVFRG